MTASLSGTSLVFLAIFSVCFFRAAVRRKNMAHSTLASLQ